MGIFQGLLYLLLWASVWLSFVLVLFATMTFLTTAGQEENEKEKPLVRGITAFGILGIFALLLIEALGLYR